MPVTLISDKRQLHLQRLNVRSENTDLLELQLHRPHLVLKERNAACAPSPFRAADFVALYVALVLSEVARR